jgi:hypothetical protein
MMTELATKLLKTEFAITLRRSLTMRAVLQDFESIQPLSGLPTIDWGRALTMASALTNENDGSAQDLALRVAQGCLDRVEAPGNHSDAATILLERMGNRPALSLAVERFGRIEDSWLDAPPPLQLDVVRRRLELSIPLAGRESINCNAFQREFWTAAAENQVTSISAPTSAGKSYIVKRWFEERCFGKAQFTGVYVVPTRALIEEVSRDLAIQFAELDVGIYTLPWDAELEARLRKVVVVTQERLHLLHQRSPTIAVDLLFVDEAQKFGDGSRGVLLQQTVEEAQRRNRLLQVIYASPMTSNPEILLTGLADGVRGGVVDSEMVTVSQNLLWVDQVRGKPKRWSVDVVVDGDPTHLGEFEVAARPHPESQRLPLVAVALGGALGGNVVYVNGPADAEKTAHQIYDALGPAAEVSSDQGVADLRELVQRTVHSQYLLATVLQRGVAYHYGNMPLLLRSEVERLFRTGSLRYLVCTSTLLEGVNLPCRNLFARNPKKGNSNPMTAGDFWNLAGRAGRWGKEFQGNIVCVDARRPKTWADLPRKRSRQPVRRVTTEMLEAPDVIRAYVEQGAPVELARQNPLMETIYSYLASTLLADAPFPGAVADHIDLQAAIGRAMRTTDIPAAMVIRHAGISPAAMQRLLERFRSYPDHRELRLELPEATEAVPTYARALGICDDALGSNFGNELRHFGLALLIVKWMRGKALAELIVDRIDYLRRRNREIRLPAEIRSVLQDVEQVARFQAPKYLSCYQDVLALHRSVSGDDGTEQDPDITMMLELGVSRTTEVSLMSWGLSRTSTVALSEFIVADDLSREDAAMWLRSHAEVLLGLPALVRIEIGRIFGDPAARHV